MREQLIYAEPRRVMVPDMGHTITDLTVMFLPSCSLFRSPYELKIPAGTEVKEISQDDFAVNDLSKVEWKGYGLIKNWSILYSDADIYGVRVPRSCVLTEQELANKRTNLEKYIAMTRDHLHEANDRDELSALEFILAEALEELEDL
jgi:hypothetical protein